MYLEVDEGFLEHPKTLQLCSMMENPLAFGHMLHFWKWAARCCKTGDLRGMSVYAIEEAARYPQHDGRLYAAMVAKLGDKDGFIDLDQNGKPTGIHNWMIRTGGSIKKMEDEAAAKKLYRLHRDGKCDGQTCPHCLKSKGCPPDSPPTVTGRASDAPSDKPTQTRPDKTSPDKTDPPSAGAPARSTPDAKIRPRTAHDLIHCLRVAVQREQHIVWNPGGSFAHKEADDFLRGFDDLEGAIGTIEAKIDLFAADPKMSPWTVAKFAKWFNEIGKARVDHQGERPGQQPIHYPPAKRMPESRVVR